VIRKVEQKDWGLIADLINKNRHFLELLEVENSHRWLVEILQNRFAYIVEDKTLVVTRDIAQHINLIDNGSPQKSILKVIYYSIPYDEKAVVEYVSELQSQFQMEIESSAIKEGFNTNGQTEKGRKTANIPTSSST